MQRKTLKKLIAVSYNEQNVLDNEKVLLVASHLTRHELKEYIRALKNYEKRKQLIVDCSFVPSSKQEEILREKFPGKDIVFHFKPDLIFGVKITDNDIVYAMNLRRTLDAMEEYLEEQYD